MPTGITHAFVAVAVGRAAFKGKLPWRFWPVAAICSALPDLDIGLMSHGVEYGDLWGHRGMSHSILFAIILSFVVSTWLFRLWWAEDSKARINDIPMLWASRRWWALFAFFSLITASHGFLDAFTNGGLGIAFFSPFDTKRYFMPWNPIEVSPIGLRDFVKNGGLDTVRSELFWIWLPVGVVTAGIVAVRRFCPPMHGHRC